MILKSVFEPESNSYTAFLYNEDGLFIEDESMYDDMEEAIKFATEHNWSEVVSDNTGKVVWSNSYVV